MRSVAGNTDKKEHTVPGYRIELHGESREVYYVEAESEDVARETWSSGSLEIQECYGMEIESIREDDIQ